MPMMKHRGHCKACENEWDIRKLDAKGKRVCPQCRSTDVEVLEIEVPSDGENVPLDPEDDFKDVLQDVGISRARETITKVFFRGDVDNIDWLDEVLKIATIPKSKRTLIKSVWFGLPSELVNDGDDDNGSGIMSGSNKKKDSLEDAMEQVEIDMAKEIKKARADKMLRELRGDDDTHKKSHKMVKVPAQNTDGSMMVGGDGRPVFYEITTEELKEMQIAQQFMNQHKPQQNNNQANESNMMMLEMMKIISGNNTNGKDSDALNKLQDKIEEMNTVMLETKIQGAFGGIMSEINKLKDDKEKGDALDRLGDELIKLKKLGVNIGGSGGVDIVEARKDRVIDEGVVELRGLRSDLSNKLDPFVQIAANSARDQLKEQNKDKQRLVDERSNISDEDAESIVRALDADSPELQILEEKQLAYEESERVKHASEMVGDMRDIQSESDKSFVSQDTEKAEEPPIMKAMIFSNSKTVSWDGEKETVIETNKSVEIPPDDIIPVDDKEE